MKTFNDNAGRTWTVAINATSIKRVKSLLGVNLLDVVEGKLIEQLISDPVLLVDVLYVLCKPEADTKQITDEDFGMAMAGDAIEHSTTCLLEELVDFFPQAKRRVMAKALAKLEAFQLKAIQLANKRLDDPKLDRQLDQILESAELPETTLGGSSGNSPASSASSPAN